MALTTWKAEALLRGLDDPDAIERRALRRTSRRRALRRAGGRFVAGVRLRVGRGRRPPEIQDATFSGTVVVPATATTPAEVSARGQLAREGYEGCL